MNPLEITQLALRIERLQQTSTHGWMNSDDMEFKNRLPMGRDPRHLPDPRKLRGMAEKQQTPNAGDYRMWLASIQHLEYLIHQNDPRNPRRIMYDMAKGKTPFQQ